MQGYGIFFPLRSSGKGRPSPKVGDVAYFVCFPSFSAGEHTYPAAATLLRRHATVTLDFQSSNMDLKGTLRAFVLRLSLLGMQTEQSSLQCAESTELPSSNCLN